jgi:hypothetical protein
MSNFRKVSESDMREAREVSVAGSITNPDATVGITLGNIQDWSDECDFITYGRTEDGTIDEASRVVWYGNKVSDTFIDAQRVGGSETHLPSPGEFATMLPTHYWANSMVNQLEKCLPDDGLGGILDLNGRPIQIVISPTQPTPISGRSIIWLRPLGA